MVYSSEAELRGRLRALGAGPVLVCRSQSTTEVLGVALEVVRESGTPTARSSTSAVDLMGEQSSEWQTATDRDRAYGKGGSVEPSTEDQLRAALIDLLGVVGAEPPIEARELCRLVGAHLGKPITVAGRPIPTASGAGSVMPIGGGYLILYQAATDPVHQAHIIFHELIHVVRGHLDRAGEQGLSCRFVEAGDEAAPADAETQAMEWEAETGARILGEWAEGDRALWESAGRDRGAFRFGAALRGRTRWS